MLLIKAMSCWHVNLNWHDFYRPFRLYEVTVAVALFVYVVVFIVFLLVCSELVQVRVT